MNALTLSIGVAAVTLASYASITPWVMVPGALLITIVLFAFDSSDWRSVWQSVAFGGVIAYSLLQAATGVFALTGGKLLLPAYWITVGWAVLTIIVALIDRSRVSGRARPEFVITPGRVTRAAAPGATLFGSAPMSAPPPSPSTTASRVQSERPPVAASEPVSAEEPATPAPASRPAPPAPAAPPPRAIELPPNVGKPATIYLNIVDAGIACLRPVQAEHLGRDFYRIVENAPPDEQWEFTTGQIVRCQKRNLSSGKALVAIEEAPRADRQA